MLITSLYCVQTQPTPGKGRRGKPQPHEHWGGASVGKFREELILRIRSLSEPWLKEKEEREKQRLDGGEGKGGDETDSDVMEVEVVEPDPPPAKASKRKGKAEAGEETGSGAGVGNRRTAGRQAAASGAGPSRGKAERLR